MDHNWITVASFADPVEANLTKNWLEEEGVSGFLEGEAMVGMAWFLTNAVGGIKLQVPERDAPRARDLLSQGLPEQRQAVRDAPAAEEADDAAPRLSRREQDADRALRASLLGLLFSPLQFYTLWLLGRVFVSNKPLGRAHRRNACVAAAIVLPVMLVFLMLLSVILSRPDGEPAPPYGKSLEVHIAI
jgi:hypothetical protein